MPRNTDECSFAGCPVTQRAGGLCSVHYQQRRLGKPLTPITANRRYRGRVATETEAECTRCDRLLSIDVFTAGAGANGKATWCRDCMTAWRYGLDTPTLLRMREEAAGRCPICQVEAVLHVDHDHTCCPYGKSCGRCVRGLLCGTCNRAIGLLKEDVDVMRRAINYLVEAAAAVAEDAS